MKSLDKDLMAKLLTHDKEQIQEDVNEARPVQKKVDLNTKVVVDLPQMITELTSPRPKSLTVVETRTETDTFYLPYKNKKSRRMLYSYSI